MEENKEQLDEVPGCIGFGLLDAKDGGQPVGARHSGRDLVGRVEANEAELEDVLHDDDQLKRED